MGKKARGVYVSQSLSRANKRSTHTCHRYMCGGNVELLHAIGKRMARAFVSSTRENRIARRIWLGQSAQSTRARQRRNAHLLADAEAPVRIPLLGARKHLGLGEALSCTLGVVAQAQLKANLSVESKLKASFSSKFETRRLSTWVQASPLAPTSAALARTFNSV